MKKSAKVRRLPLPPRPETPAELIERTVPYRALTLGAGSTGFVEVPLKGALGLMISIPDGAFEIRLRDGAVEVRGHRSRRGVDVLSVRPRAANVVEITLGSL